MTTEELGIGLVDRREHDHGVDTAVFSPDRTHRYSLTRVWGAGPHALWIMLNPSTADAFADDPTIRRCVGFTKALGGYGGLAVVNLYSLRATDPRELWTHPAPFNPLTRLWLAAAPIGRGPVIAAWGTHGARHGRGEQVARELTRAGVALHCLGTTKDGHPKHPLYVPGDTPIVPFPQVEAS